MKLIPYLSFLFLFVASSCSKNNEQDYSYICTDEFQKDNTTLSDQLKGLEQKLDSSTGTYLLEHGQDAMIARAWLCEYAEKSIDVQYFIFSADNIGLIGSDLLLRAAERGVKVRILVDDIVVNASPEELLALNEHPNLTIKIYNPNANIGKTLVGKLYSAATDFKNFNQRMHNKTFTVDNKVVITGGRNIADEYFDYDHEYNFRDRDVLLLGKGTTPINTSFEEFWNSKLSIEVNQVVNEQDYDVNTEEKYAYLHQYACNPENFQPAIRKRIKEIPFLFKNLLQQNKIEWVKDFRFVSDVPGKNNSSSLNGGGRTTDTLVGLIQKAKKSITIQTPYLITTEQSRSLLKDAVDRGVKVKILTNSLGSTDALEAFNGYQRDRTELLNTGVEIYEFKPNPAIRKEVLNTELHPDSSNTPIFGLHAKSMVIDEEIAVIGTFNFDPRSSNLNTECLSIIYSQPVAFQLKRTMEKEFQEENAWKVTHGFNPDSTCTVFRQWKSKVRTLVPKSIL